MRSHHKIRILMSFLFMAFFITYVFSAQPGAVPQQTQTDKFPLDKKIPVDPKITLGQLENGLKYYIRVNSQPENRAELRLVVNAGSVLEEDNQQGLAHFVEHMAFNGTEHFAKHELTDFLESIGMRFGPDLNAYTSFDDTVYKLKVPTDKPKILKTSFQILEDWAHGIAFEDEEIAKERGVIIEEWRLGQGARARMRNKQFPILFKGSRYAERMPIGKKEIIKNISSEKLRRFYKDWYRPDLMAVVAVGDFDKDEVERLIKQHFSGMVNPPDPPPRQIFPVPDHDSTMFAIATDKEATRTSVAVYHKLPLQDESTIGSFRKRIVEILFISMFNTRFFELAQKSDSPFLMAFAGKGRLIRSKEVFMLSAAVKEGKIGQGLKALYRESERVSRFGFTESELKRQKKNILRSVERSYAEREKQNSRLYAAEYIRNFLHHEPTPGIEYEFELDKHFMPGITTDEINRLVKEWITEKNRVIMVNAPEKEGVPVPGEKELEAILEGIEDQDIAPYEDKVTDKPLLSDVPEPGSIVKSKFLEEIRITEWTLSNGVQVVLKPTDFKEDEIRFRAISPGGTSLADDKNFIPAKTADRIIAKGGVGEFNYVNLRKKLSGKAASVRPVINELEEGLSGSASPKDLETLFQLIYLTVTAPRADDTVFDVIKTQMKSSIENRRKSPEIVFSETFKTTISQNHLRRKPLTLEDLDKMDLQKSYDFYKERFADASDFTFIFVGNLDLQDMKPLVARYIGGLPVLDREESWRDVGVEPPQGVVKKTVKKGIEPKSLVRIAFTGPFEYDVHHRNAIRAVSSILQTRLRKLIREDLSGTYRVGVKDSYSKIPEEDYSITINFGTDPKRVEELIDVVFKEIERLKTQGPNEEEVNDVREAELRSYETNIKQNSWLLGQLVYKYRYGEDPTSLIHFPETLKRLNPDVVKEAAQTYFNTENYVQIVLYPEEKNQ